MIKDTKIDCELDELIEEKRNTTRTVSYPGEKTGTKNQMIAIYKRLGTLEIQVVKIYEILTKLKQEK